MHLLVDAGNRRLGVPSCPTERLFRPLSGVTQTTTPLIDSAQLDMFPCVFNGRRVNPAEGPINFGDGVGERLGAKQTCPPGKWPRGEPFILSPFLPAGITMGLDVAGVTMAT